MLENTEKTIKKIKPKGLGKGLDALIPQSTAKQDGQQTLPIHQIKPNENQPRKEFEPVALEELAKSLEQVGMLQPILVKKQGAFYQIIAGERRWRAAQLANLSHVPVIIKELDDKAIIQVALLENIQREDLNPIEAAIAFEQLIEEHQLTHQAVSEILGKSRSSITNTLRLLQLSDMAQQYLIDGKISMGHAKLLIPLEKKIQENFLEEISEGGLSVRETEVLLQTELEKETTKTPAKETKNIQKMEPYNELERDLELIYGTKVKILQQQGKKNGKIEIGFSNMEELDRLFIILRNKNR